MRRTFLRLWLACAALFAAGMVAHEGIVFFAWSEDEVAFWDEMSAPAMRLGADVVAREGASPDVLTRLEAQMGSPVAVVDALPREAAAQLADGEEVAWMGDDGGGTLFIAVEGRAAWLRVGPMPAYPTPALAPRLALLLVVVGGLAVATGALLRPLDRSQRSVVEGAVRLAGGDLSARIPAEEAEVAPAVAESFNEMAHRIESLVDHQRHMLRSASHELRTPLARLRLGIHLLADAEDDRAERAEALEGDLDELDALVDDILTHARVEREGVRQRTGPVALGPVVTAALAGHRPLAGQVAFEVGDRVADVDVQAVPKLLRRALDNVVGNARRYAASCVRITAVPVEDAVHIVIDDDGPGIPAEQREEARAAFRTLDERSGHGMGLAIVDRIVVAHGGALRLEDAPIGGLRVVLVWPQTG